MKNVNFFMIILVFIMGLMAVTYYRASLVTDDIKEWAIKHNYIAIDYDLKYTTFGTPFNYVSKGCLIYKIKVNTASGEEETWWFRESAYGADDYVKAEKE